MSVIFIRNVEVGFDAQLRRILWHTKKDKLHTIVIDAKSPDKGISKADLPQVQSYAISPDIKSRARFVMLSNGYATQTIPIERSNHKLQANFASTPKILSVS